MRRLPEGATMKIAPYATRTDARVALAEAGYIDTHVPGRRPRKWVHPTSGKRKAVQERPDGRWKIVPYPKLKGKRYRLTTGPDKPA